ncbi:prenyltransferase/squalene oxidase repeat-containing protein [Thermopirellula anaerolimosa]
MANPFGGGVPQFQQSQGRSVPPMGAGTPSFVGRQRGVHGVGQYAAVGQGPEEQPRRRRTWRDLVGIPHPADEEEDLSDAAVRYAPPWLVSAIFHTLLMVILALIMLPQMWRRDVELTAEIYAEKLGEQLEFDSPFAGNDPENVEEPILTPRDLPEVENPFAAPPSVEMVQNGVTATSDIKASAIGYALQGREEGRKRSLLAAYGGTALTEAAVNRGLEWLARQQLKDGSWSLQGPYSAGGQEENHAAATAMALLAFQGAGNTHKQGRFRENVRRGWDWLLQQQDNEGNFFHSGGFNHRYYTQGQCTIALCEILGMTREERFREPAIKAIDHLLRSQSEEGGWRYSPNADSDVSVTGWIVMALQSARMAGLEVPSDNLRRVERFLDRVALENGAKYPYQKGRQATLAMTAEALLMRQYLGWPRTDDRMIKGLDWITQPVNLISFEDNKRDVYYWYYAAQACHHMEGEHWKRWNGVMRQILPEQQVKSGPEAGSWDPRRPTEDAWANEAGRLYVTCLSIYCLEVYYRHLPLYSNPFQFVAGEASRAVPAEPAAAPTKLSQPDEGP